MRINGESKLFHDQFREVEVTCVADGNFHLHQGSDTINISFDFLKEIVAWAESEKGNDDFDNHHVAHIQSLILKLEIEEQNKNSEDKTFFYLLEECCKTLHLTNDDLCEEFSMSRPSAARWRAGETSPHRAIRPVVYRRLRMLLLGMLESKQGITISVDEGIEIDDSSFEE